MSTAVDSLDLERLAEHLGDRFGRDARQRGEADGAGRPASLPIPDVAEGSSALARPKSRTFTWPSGVTLNTAKSVRTSM